MWIIKAFGLGALAITALLFIIWSYCRLKEYLTDKHGCYAMTMFWAFIVASMISGCFIMKLLET